MTLIIRCHCIRYQKKKARALVEIFYLAPEDHRETLPEAVGGFATPVGDEPLEGGVLDDQQHDTHEESDDEQEVEPGVLVELHRLRKTRNNCIDMCRTWCCYRVRVTNCRDRHAGRTASP